MKIRAVTLGLDLPASEAVAARFPMGRWPASVHPMVAEVIAGSP